VRPRNLLRLCLISSVFPAFPALAWADDAPQEITVTATRIPTAAQNVPAGVTVITKEDFAKRGYTTLVQALSAVPGLGVVQSGGSGGQASVFIRGTDSEDVLVLLNGVPVNDPSDPNGAFNFGDYTLSDVERIEVVRGAMSGLYGSNAIGGVINIITVQGSGKPKASVELAGGFPSQGQGSATISGSTGKFDYALSGALDEESGFDDTAKRLSVYAGNKDPFRSKLGSLNVGYTPVAGTRIYAVVRAQEVDSAFPDLGYPVFDDPNEYDYNTNLFGKLGVSSELFNGLLSTDLFVAQIQNELHYSNLLDANDPNFAQANDYYHGYRTDAQWNNTLHLPDAGVATGNSLLFGVEYSNDTAHENVNEDAGSYTVLVHASQHTVAGHLGVQTTLANRLTLTAALRDDAVSSFGNALTGRIGGVLAVPEADVRLKASYGTGFLAPSLFDLYGVDSFGYVGNPHLHAEYSSGFEVGPQFDIPAFGQDDFASLSATYFQSSIRDLITVTPDFESEENVGRVKINGLESEAVLNPAPWLSADITYTYTRAIDAQTGDALLRRPQNAGSATLTLTPTPRLSIVPQVQYVGRFIDYLYGDDGYPIGDGSADPGTIVNLSASYQINDKLSLFAAGKNIFGSKFEAVNGLQIPGASLLIGLRATIQ
jgi:vitamin B12 transporter